MIQPFHISIPEGTLADLRHRLDTIRWPLGVTDSGGIPLAEVRALVDYWRSSFNWAIQEQEINRFPHFMAQVGGEQIHLIHLRSPNLKATPLLLLHGWPGSFVEMLPVLPLLTERFHLVVPSLPGYGFSPAPARPGMSNARIALLGLELMSLLGYPRFVVQGGDWGAGIATWATRQDPARILGLHLNYIPGSYGPSASGNLTPEESAFQQVRATWREEMGGYGHIQSTRPLTLAYGLSDSPVGLAAWIAEKFKEWADPARPIPMDVLLTNVTIYWASNSIASSVRLYLESMATPLRFEPGERLQVPCGVARFPAEAPFPPRAWVERGYNVVRWTEMPRGGHFAALEEPGLLAADLIAFVDGLWSL